MAFPETPLPLKVELRLGSTWTDFTSRVRAEQQIRISRGRSDWGQQVDASRCAFTLDNNDGAMTPRNPTGPYYGSIGRNTPCRVSVMTGSTYLDLPGSSTSDYAQTVDDATLDVVGDLDLRIDMTLANWIPPILVGQTTVEWIGKASGPGAVSWFLGARNGRIYFEWSADGTNLLGASSTIPPVVPGSGRMAVRVWLDVDNGSGQNVVRFYTAENLDAPWVQLGDPVTQSGVTSIFNSTSPVRIGNATGFSRTLPLGRCHAAEIRNGDWGPIVAQPRFDEQAVGAASFVDSAGRTWTTNNNSQITNRRTRFVGEISAWNVRWETRHDVVVNVEASGITRRMSQGASPVRSPMYRELTNPNRSNIVAYWPMEDEAQATTFASAMDGHAAMPIPGTGGVTPAAYSGWAASAPLPTYSFGTTKVQLPAYTATNYIFTRLFVEVPVAGVTGTDRLFSFTTTGTARTWSLFLDTAGNLDLRAYDTDGTQLFASGFGVFQINGKQRHIAVELTQTGADVEWDVLTFRIDESTLSSTLTTSMSGTLAGYTCGAATEARIGQSGLLNGTAIGHLAFADLNTAYADTGGAMIGWNGEATSSRLYRLGVEELSPCFGASISDEQMGVQGLSTVLELMREAETADEGILFESREHYPGFRFRDHVSLYNQTAVMVLDYTGSDGLVTPLDPVDDDQAVRNDITVQRTGGSSTRRTLDSGPLSTAVPPDGVGIYTDSVTKNLYADAQTSEHAGWRLHVGTWDETRYPVVRIMLANATHMIEDAASVDIGDRMHITNPPSWLPPDTIDLIVQGYQEVLDQFTWTIDYNCSPAGSWDVTWAGDDDTASSFREFQWVDTDGSQLAEDLTSTETAVDVYTASGGLWTPRVRDMPFDWRIGGEVMTVTAPHSLINANPFFGTDVSDWSVENSTLSRSTTYVHPHPRATASMLITPSGGAAFVGAQAGITAVGSITPGATYVVGYWAFSVDGWSDIRPTVTWYDSAAVFISTVSATAAAIPSSVWTYFEAEFVAPANASRAQGRVRMGSTPAATDLLWVWAARGPTRGKSSAVYDTFGRTAASGWGAAGSGQTWSVVGTAADYSVNGTYAIAAQPSTGIAHLTTIAAPAADVDLYVDVAASALATGASLYTGPIVRATDNNNLYQARVDFNTSNQIVLTVRKRVAGVETQLGSTFTSTITHVAGTFYRVRLQVFGSALKAKVWLASDNEPGIWHIETTDTAITTAGNIGTRSFRNTGNTNASAELRFDNFDLVNPQTYTVVRSQNGVSKTHTAGAAVALANPAIVAL
jgi:hypothetical protein